MANWFNGSTIDEDWTEALDLSAHSVPRRVVIQNRSSGGLEMEVGTGVSDGPTTGIELVTIKNGAGLTAPSVHVFTAVSGEKVWVKRAQATDVDWAGYWE